MTQRLRHILFCGLLWLYMGLVVMLVLNSGCKVTNIFRRSSPAQQDQTPQRRDMISEVGYHTMALVPTFKMVTNRLGVLTIPPNVPYFRLYHGTNSGSYFESWMIPAQTNFFIVHAHWKGVRDYFAATSVNSLGIESAYSTEAWIPLFEPTMIIVAGQTNGPMLLSESLDLRQWTVVVITTNPYIAAIQGPARFFRSNQMLTIRAFNPLNP